MTTLKLELPRADYDALHVAVHKVRKGTKKVSVDRDALAALLIDHGRILTAINGKWVDHDDVSAQASSA